MSTTDQLWEYYGHLRQSATSSKDKWEATVGLARTKAHMFIGDAKIAHLSAIRDSIRVITDSECFGTPDVINLTISPRQFLMLAEANALAKSIDTLCNWTKHELYIDVFEEAFERFRNGESSDPILHKMFDGSSPPDFITALSPAYLSAFFYMGIRTEEGLWSQSYRNGQPVCPLMCHKVNDRTSFITAGNLASEWYVGLPYSVSAVTELAKSNFEFPINIDWIDSDDLIDESLFAN